MTSSWCANGVLHQTARALSNSRIGGSLYRYGSCHDLAGQISPFGEAHCRGGWTPFTTHAADSTLSLAHYDWLLIGKVVEMLTSAYKYRQKVPEFPAREAMALLSQTRLLPLFHRIPTRHQWLQKCYTLKRNGFNIVSDKYRFLSEPSRQGPDEACACAFEWWRNILWQGVWEW